MRQLAIACLIFSLFEVFMVRPVNAAGLALTTNAEGCVLYTYDDATGRMVTHVGQAIKGKLTAGFGHTGNDLAPGMRVTQQMADEWFKQDMSSAAAIVEEAVQVDLNDNQFSALSGFVFNIGRSKFLGSTLLKQLNAGNYAAVPGQLHRWVYANGKIAGGLVARRNKEASLFLLPVAFDTSSVHITSATNPASVAVAQARPSAPSIIERLRAWLHGSSPAAEMEPV